MSSSSGHVEEPKNFEPKTPVTINPPKDDPITVEELAKYDGKLEERQARCTLYGSKARSRR